MRRNYVIVGDMRYRKIGGLSRYRIYADGSIVSTWNGLRALRCSPDKDGYPKVVLIDDIGSRRYLRRSSLVCMAFHGPRPTGGVVRHLDGSKDNDTPDNLCWGTQKENMADRVIHGTQPRGITHWHASITDGTAREIKRLILLSRKTADIMEALSVSRATVNGIRYGQSWKWLGEGA
jgi:hypothetical protein